MVEENNCLGKILIIDDEKENTEIIRDILEDVNYFTVIARSASEAKTMVEGNAASQACLFIIVILAIILLIVVLCYNNNEAFNNFGNLMLVKENINMRNIFNINCEFHNQV